MQKKKKSMTHCDKLVSYNWCYIPRINGMYLRWYMSRKSEDNDCFSLVTDVEFWQCEVGPVSVFYRLKLE